LTSGRLRRNRRIGYLLVVVFAVLLPTVDPVSLAFELVPLLLLYELSIWLSVLMERRWLSADATQARDPTPGSA
jgi:sec-independent protein translocase protein TatC